MTTTITTITKPEETTLSNSLSVQYLSLQEKEPEFDRSTIEILAEIREAIGNQNSLNETMEAVWTKTLPILPHDRIGLAFIDNDQQRVSSIYVRTTYDPDTIILGNEYGTGLANSSLLPIIETGRARIINNLETYLHHNPDSASTRLLLKEGVHSNLTLPLKVDQRNIGFLFFSSKESDVFTIHHAQILLAVLSTISQTIEKVWRIAKLEESRRDYLTMLGFVSHEMKSPLAAMMSVGTTYLKGYMGTVDPLAASTMQRMMKISGYLINMVNNYLDLSRLESGEMKFAPKEGLNFKKDIVDFALDTVSARAEERGTVFNVEAPAEELILTGDEDLLRIVAVNLLDNAVKYGDEKITVQVSIKKENGKIVFSVRNQGVGFTKEQSRQLFRRFSRLKQKGTEDRRGTGLGLYLTWWIVQKHNGRITCNSEPGQWAEFTVYLN